MDQHTLETLTGVKVATLVFAFIGSAISLRYTKEMTKFQMVTALLTGIAVAVAGAPLALHYVVHDETLERSVSFVLALCAMRLIPTAFAWVDSLRDIKLPSLPGSKE